MNGHAEELARLAAVRRVSAETAAAAHLCGVALDRGVVGLCELRAAVDGCSTRAQLEGILLALAAVVVSAQRGREL